jgi:cytochrome c peroxidase
MKLVYRLIKQFVYALIHAIARWSGQRWSKSRLRKNATISAFVLTIVLAGQMASAQLNPGVSQPLGSLKTVPVPEPSNLGEFVQNKTAAIALGKTLFWDMQVGSDGRTSCASCHFHAGADNRAKNQLHPGPDTAFAIGDLNYILKPEDFPFHKLADPNNRSSLVLADSNDVTGSQGVHLSKFIDINPGNAQDNVIVQPDPVFNVNGINVRQTTGRNTPSVINAIFNFRNFWDGRAQNDFNGVNPFGSRDPNAYVLKAPTKQSALQKVKVRLDNASLASQAVGPPLSSVEESATGRVFADVGQKFGQIKARKLPRETGKKLRTLPPLAKQLIDPQDSVLGFYSAAPKPGFKQLKSYESLVRDAFRREWWDSPQIIKVGMNGTQMFTQPQGALATDEFTLMDYNFSLFMGLSIQLYESTLVSNDAPIDRFFEGNFNALTAQQKQGKDLFEGKAKCLNCHGGAEFTNASTRNVRNERLERMEMGNGGVAVYDNGFYNIGVRPTAEDLGVGGNDPFGHPLSESRLAQKGQFRDPNLNPPVGSTERIAADGAFKTPGLRNVELTAPYLHNGGLLTLPQVVDFYNRGGDFHEQNIDNLDPDIQNLGLNQPEKAAIVSFLTALTDERVRNHSAPFDHPQLFIPKGHLGNANFVTNDGTGKATDDMIEIAATGRNGGNPLSNFLAGSSAAAAPQQSTLPLEGSITQQDCPAGSSLKLLPSGYTCLTTN